MNIYRADFFPSSNDWPDSFEARVFSQHGLMKQSHAFFVRLNVEMCALISLNQVTFRDVVMFQLNGVRNVVHTFFNVMLFSPFVSVLVLDFVLKKKMKKKTMQ